MNHPIVCTRCVMDTSDPAITFDAVGVCNHCRYYDRQQQERETAGRESFDALVARIKQRGKAYPYDCIAAISGGTDSSYMLHCLKRSGLRILAVHYDSGWNTEEATHNIRVLTERMGLELETCMIDPEEFRSLQLAYLAAGVVDLDVPTDHGLYGSLFRVAAEEKAPFILTGHNVSTELIMPDAWVCDKLDSRNLRDIHRQHGEGTALRSFPLQTPWRKFLNYNIRKIEMIFVLNYLSYDKAAASELLQREYQWQPVRVKHGESIWTRFYQCYILPTRHGIDKRRAHFSNLILSGTISREAALEELQQPPYKDDLAADRALILERYRISEDELERYMTQPIRQHSDFRTEKALKTAYARLRSLRLFRNLFHVSTRH